MFFTVMIATAGLPSAIAQTAGTAPIQIIPVGQGWARSSVNAVIFRQNSIISHQSIQFTAFYDPEGKDGAG